MPSSSSENVPQKVQIEISTATILKVLTALSIIYIIILSRDFILLLVLSSLIAVTLAPILETLIGHGMSRRGAFALLSATFIGLFVAMFVFLVPPLTTEMGNLSATLPGLRESILQNLPTTFGLRHSVEGIFAAPINGEKILGGLMSVGQAAMGGATSLLMLIVFSLYLLADGPRAYEWLLPYFSLRNQRKISLTIDEVLKVVTAYISGQLFTSVLAALFTFALLSVLGVPAALVLSVLAGIFDILPIVGFFLFVIPAGLLALTVSTSTGIWVLAAYTGYHLLETYIIIPKVYGNRMRLSALVVLLGLMLGGLLGGVLGAIAIMPILASYPIIERVWLIKQVGIAAVEEHSSKESDPPERTADAVTQERKETLARV